MQAEQAVKSTIPHMTMSHDVLGFWRAKKIAVISLRRPVQWASLLCVTWRAIATQGGFDEAIGKYLESGTRGEAPLPPPKKEAVRLELSSASWLMLTTVYDGRATKVNAWREHYTLSPRYLDSIL